ncbi:MAG: archaellin/type IV pilin N-terminal domain-containing protein [archaeon]
MKKNGVSPLIATVLLIGFTVAIVSLLIIWGTNFLQETAEKEGAQAEGELNCQFVDFTVTNVDISGDNFEITISNFNEDPIDAFVFRIEDTNGDYYPFQVYDSISGAGISTIQAVDTGLTDYNTLQVIPRLEIANNVYVTCEDQSLTWQK